MLPRLHPSKLSSLLVGFAAQTERFAIGEELWYSLPIPFNVGHNGRGWTFVLTLKVRTHSQRRARVFSFSCTGLNG